MDDGEALLAVLSSRRRLLEELQRESLGTGALATRLDVSESTVRRGIAELESFDLLDRRGDRYVVTSAGSLALAEYGRFVGRVDDLVAARSVLAALPTMAAFDPALLEGSSVESVRRDGTQAALAPHVHLVETAANQRGYVPTFLHRLVGVYSEAVSDGLECDLAFTPSALDRLVRSYREPVTAAIQSGQIQVREATASIPYALIVSRGLRSNEEGSDVEGVRRAPRSAGSDAVTVLIHGENGLAGVIYNDTPAALRWAESTLDDVWREAKTLTTSP